MEAFQAAGIRVDLVVTDHAGRPGGRLGKIPVDALLQPAPTPDDLLLRVSGGGVRAARQFPAALADSPAEIVSAASEMSGGDAPAVSVGELPASLAGAVPGLSSIPLPEGVPPSHLSAYGAALTFFLPKAAGGYSLRLNIAEAAGGGPVPSAQRSAMAAVAAPSVAAVIAVGALLSRVWTSARKAAKARAQVRKEFSEAAPDVRLREATAGVQIREKLASVKRLQKELGADAPPVAELLSVASASLPEGQIAVREASAEGRRLRLVGEAKDAALVESYRAGLLRVRPELRGDAPGLRGQLRGFRRQVHDPRREEGGGPCFLSGETGPRDRRRHRGDPAGGGIPGHPGGHPARLARPGDEGRGKRAGRGAPGPPGARAAPSGNRPADRGRQRGGRHEGIPRGAHHRHPHGRGIPQSAVSLKSGGGRDGEMFREESFEVRMENLTYLEAVNALQKLSGTDQPVVVRSALLKSRYDDPRYLDVTLNVGYLSQKQP